MAYTWAAKATRTDREMNLIISTAMLKSTMIKAKVSIAPSMTTLTFKPLVEQFTIVKCVQLIVSNLEYSNYYVCNLVILNYYSYICTCTFFFI